MLTALKKGFAFRWHFERCFRLDGAYLLTIQASRAQGRTVALIQKSSSILSESVLNAYTVLIHEAVATLSNHAAEHHG